MSDDKVYDLTTLLGLRHAAEDLPWWGIVLNPTGYVVAKVFAWLASPSEVSPEKQAEAAERIIEAGRRNGAKRIRFKVDKDVGARLAGSAEGANIQGHLGVDGKMELDVEYK